MQLQYIVFFFQSMHVSQLLLVFICSFGILVLSCSLEYPPHLHMLQKNQGAVTCFTVSIKLQDFRLVSHVVFQFVSYSVCNMPQGCSCHQLGVKYHQTDIFLPTGRCIYSHFVILQFALYFCHHFCVFCNADTSSNCFCQFSCLFVCLWVHLSLMHPPISYSQQTFGSEQAPTKFVAKTCLVSKFYCHS